MGRNIVIPGTAVTWEVKDPMIGDTDWTKSARCADARPDELFVRGAAQHRAKRLCASCPVRTECLIEALDQRIEWGIWGGMTERERRALLRKRPTVTSWRRLLQATPNQVLAPSRASA